MTTLETNLASAARENFRLFPQCYPVQTSTNVQEEEEGDVFAWNQDEAIFLTDEAEENLRTLADSYGKNDGFYAAGMTKSEALAIVRNEFKSFLQ